VKTARSAEEKTATAMSVLEKEPLGGYQWKEYWQQFKRYGNGDPDFWGRRLLDVELQKKARYVARVCNRARASRALPSGKEWGYLRAALLQVYGGL
jgi:hypothetical protein